MLHRSIPTLLLSFSLSAAHAAQKTLSVAASSVADRADDQTVKIVEAAEVLLGTLNDEERSKIFFKFNDEDAAPKLMSIDTTLADTFFSWRGGTKPGSPVYYRVQGPSLFLEFAPQRMGGAPMQHVHAMYREFKNDYGEEILHAK